MEADVGTASDRNPGWGSGRHVVVACPVVALFMADGADERKLVRDACQARHVLANLHARCFGRNRVELATHFTGSFGLRIEGFVVCRPAIEPNQDAALRLGPVVDRITGHGS